MNSVLVPTVSGSAELHPAAEPDGAGRHPADWRGAAANLVGTPESMATTIDEYLQADASDGLIFVPLITPDGLGEFADEAVPMLQERGVFWAEFEGTTLRDHLELPAPAARPRGRSGAAS